MRMDPPPSVPSESGAYPAATAADDPPEEPPGVSAVFHGLRVFMLRTDSVRPEPPQEMDHLPPGLYGVSAILGLETEGQERGKGRRGARFEESMVRSSNMLWIMVEDESGRSVTMDAD